jgi:hypothetical protein
VMFAQFGISRIAKAKVQRVEGMSHPGAMVDSLPS